MGGRLEMSAFSATGARCVRDDLWNIPRRQFAKVMRIAWQRVITESLDKFDLHIGKMLGVAKQECGKHVVDQKFSASDSKRMNENSFANTNARLRMDS